jgi:hypothetical protein
MYYYIKNQILKVEGGARGAVGGERGELGSGGRGSEWRGCRGIDGSGGIEGCSGSGVMLRWIVLLMGMNETLLFVIMDEW